MKLSSHWLDSLTNKIIASEDANGRLNGLILHNTDINRWKTILLRPILKKISINIYLIY